MAQNSFSLRITFIEAKGPLIKLWGQTDLRTVEYLDKKLIILNEQFNKGGGKPLPPSVNAGQMCYAQYGDIFYRAKVINNINFSSGVVFVRFIDFGNSKVTSVQNTRVIDGDVASIAPQAREFYLYGVAPLSGPDLEEVTVDYMLQHMRCHDLQAVLVCSVDNKMFIKLFQNGVDLGDSMIMQKFAVPVDPLTQEEYLRSVPNQLSPTVQQWQQVPSSQVIPEAVSIPNSVYEVHGNAQNMGRFSLNYAGAPHTVGETTVKTFTSPILEPNSEHEVYVSNVEDGPLSFAVQLQAAEQTLMAVTADIASHRPMPLREPPVPGSVCLARFPGDTKLCRATIMEVMDTTCKLYYVDFGNVCDVLYTDIFELPAKLINPKAMALRFCLAGLKRGPPPSPAAKEAFRNIVQGCLLTLRVAPSPEGPPLKQYGYLYRDGRDVRLMYEELAREKISRMGVPIPLVDGSIQTLYYEPANSESIRDGNWVTISHIISPDEFWVQLETDQPRLEYVMTLLDECCRLSGKIPVMSDLRPKVPIFAQFSEDDRWYRASIRKIEPSANGANVLVEFVDYGNEEAITDFGRLRLAEVAVVKALPAQAIRCRLYGAANVRYKVGTELWEQISAKFTDLTLETRGMVKLGPRGAGDPVVVIEELRDDTLKPPVVITMEAIHKAVVGGVLDVNQKINLTIIAPNDKADTWEDEPTTGQDLNANTAFRSSNQSGWGETWQEKKPYEEQGRRIGGRNSSQEQGYRDGKNKYEHQGGKAFGGGRGYQTKNTSDNESKEADWQSGGSVKSTDSGSPKDSGESYGNQRYGGHRGKGAEGGGWENRDSFSHEGGGNDNFGRGGYQGGRGGYRGGRSGDDWKNKDFDGGSGRGGYRGGRGGRSDGDRDSRNYFDSDRGSRGGYRGRRDGGGWGGNSFGQEDGGDGFGGRFGGSSRGGRRGDNDWDNKNFGSGGRRGGFEGDNDDSSGGFQGRRGGYRGGRGGGDREFREKKFGWNDSEGSRGFQNSRGGGGRRDEFKNEGFGRSNYNDGLQDKMSNLNINEVESTEDWGDPPEKPEEVAPISAEDKLTSYSVCLGEIEPVTVVFVESRNNFYCHLNKDGEKLEEIMANLAEKYGTVEETVEKAAEVKDSVGVDPEPQESVSKKLKLVDLKVGMPCAALYSEDGVWYRARVSKEPAAESVEVNFVDYGNGAEVDESGIKELKSDLRQLPAQAIRCSLLGFVEGEGNATVDEEFELEIAEFSLEATFVRRKMPDGNECAEIVLKNKDDGECLNLRYGGKDVEEDFVVEDSNPLSSSSAEDDIPMPVIPYGKTVDIEVVYVLSRGEFYCQLKESNEKLTEVMSTLAEMCVKDETDNLEKSGKATQLKLVDVKVGMPCAALYSEDSVWYRAVISEEHKEDSVDVYFIDFGNSGTVAEGSVKELNSELCELPAQAVQCCLLGVEDSEEVNEGMDEEFETEMSAGETFEATCVRKRKLNGKEIVDVILKKKDTQEVLNVRFGGSEEFPDNHEEVSPEESEMELTEQVIPRVEFVEGTTCDVDVVYVISRSEFYCQMKSYSEQLQEVMGSLSLQCDEEEEKEEGEVPVPCEDTLRMLSLRPGMPCAALFAEDNLWYRALVLEEPKVKECGSGFVVKVKFVDYGNDALVEDSGIRELTPELLTHSAFGIPCCLLGLDENFVQDDEVETEFEQTTVELHLEALFVEKASGREHFQILLKDPNTLENITERFGGIGDVVGGKGFGLRPAMRRESKENVMVLWFVSPYRFYVQPLGWGKGLQDYMEKLQKAPKKKLSTWPPAVGTPVLARFAQDGGIYRAMVEEILLNSTVRVQYVDYGNRESLASSSVWEADPSFQTLSPQAIPCALQGVAPLTTSGWPLPGCADGSLDKYFSIENCSCIFHGPVKNELEVDGGIEGEARVWVSLIRPDGTDVAEELISLGLANRRPVEVEMPSKAASVPSKVNDVVVGNGVRKCEVEYVVFDSAQVEDQETLSTETELLAASDDVEGGESSNQELTVDSIREETTEKVEIETEIVGEGAVDEPLEVPSLGVESISHESVDMEKSLEKLSDVHVDMVSAEGEAQISDSDAMPKSSILIESDAVSDSKVEADSGKAISSEVGSEALSGNECLPLESLDMNLATEKLGEVHKNLMEEKVENGDNLDSKGGEDYGLEINDMHGFEMEESLEYISDDALMGGMVPSSIETSFHEVVQVRDNAEELPYESSANSVPASSLQGKDEQDELDFEDAEDEATSALAKDILRSTVDGDKDAAARVQQVVERYYQETAKPLGIDKIQVGGDFLTPSAEDNSKLVAVKVLDLSGTVGAVVEFKDGFVDEVPLDKIYECPPEMAVLPSPEASPMSSLTIVGGTVITDNVVVPKEMTRKLEEVKQVNDETEEKNTEMESTSQLEK